MTEYADPVFPLPEPTFLWVYDMVVWTSASVQLGRMRKWVNQSASAGITGYVGGPNRNEIRVALQQSTVLDAVAIVPNGTAVDEAAVLEVLAAPVNAGSFPPPTQFVGRFGIHAVRPNPSHTRLLLTRRFGTHLPHDGGPDA